MSQSPGPSWPIGSTLLNQSTQFINTFVNNTTSDWTLVWVSSAADGETFDFSDSTGVSFQCGLRMHQHQVASHIDAGGHWVRPPQTFTLSNPHVHYQPQVSSVSATPTSSNGFNLVANLNMFRITTSTSGASFPNGNGIQPFFDLFVINPYDQTQFVFEQGALIEDWTTFGSAPSFRYTNADGTSGLGSYIRRGTLGVAFVDGGSFSRHVFTPTNSSALDTLAKLETFWNLDEHFIAYRFRAPVDPYTLDYNVTTATRVNSGHYESYPEPPVPPPVVHLGAIAQNIDTSEQVSGVLQHGVSTTNGNIAQSADATVGLTGEVNAAAALHEAFLAESVSADVMLRGFGDLVIEVLVDTVLDLNEEHLEGVASGFFPTVAQQRRRS